MSRTDKQVKGDIYEAFTKEMLLMKEFSFEYNGKFFSFDSVAEENKIEGISGTKHQIDIHLKSSKDENLHLICECKDHKNKTTKGLACTFATVVDDIKKYHLEWNIIPVFASNTGFESGAKKILKQYNIEVLSLKNLSNLEIKLEITESYRILERQITKVCLSDDSVVDNNSYFTNVYIGDTLSALDLLRYFELYDNHDNRIENLMEYRGFFKTKERINFSNNEKDKFILLDDKLQRELKGFEGYIKGVEKCKESENKTILLKDYKAVLVQEDNTEIVFKKDSQIFKVQPIKKE